MLAEGGDWRTKPCCVLVNRLPKDHVRLLEFRSKSVDDELLYSAPPVSKDNSPDCHLIPLQQHSSKMAVSDAGDQETLVDTSRTSDNINGSTRSKGNKSAWSVIKSNSAPDLHSLISNTATSNSTPNGPASQELPSLKRNSIDLCSGISGQYADSASASTMADAIKIPTPSNTATMSSKKIYPKRKCAFYFSYDGNSWRSRKLVGQRVSTKDANATITGDGDLNKDGACAALPAEQNSGNGSDTDVCSNDDEDECALCLVEKTESSLHHDANSSITDSDVVQAKENKLSDSNHECDFDKCERPVDRGMTPLTCISENFADSHSNHERTDGSFLVRDPENERGESLTSRICSEQQQVHMNEHCQGPFFTSKMEAVTSGLPDGDNKHQGAADSSLRVLKLKQDRNLPCSDVVKKYPRHSRPTSDPQVSRVSCSTTVSTSNANAYEGRKMADMYSIVPQENKDYNRTVITLQRATAPICSKVKKMRKKRGRRKRILISCKSPQAVRYATAPDLRNTSTYSTSTDVKQEQQQTKKCKKMSALSVYTQISDGIIRQVCCKRFKKRSKKGLLDYFKFPKLESANRGRKQTDSGCKDVPEVTTECYLRKNTVEKHDEPSVDHVVRNIVDNMLDCVYKDSLSTIHDVDIVENNYKFKYLLRSFCEDYGFRWSEFDDLSDPNALCKTLSVEDSHLDGSYSAPSSGRRLYYSQNAPVKRRMTAEDSTETEELHHIAWNVKRRRKNVASKNVVKRFFTRSAARSLASSCDLQEEPCSDDNEEEFEYEDNGSPLPAETTCNRNMVKQRLEERYKTLNHISSGAPFDRADKEEPTLDKRKQDAPSDSMDTSVTTSAVEETSKSASLQAMKDKSVDNTSEAETKSVRTPRDATESAGKSSSQSVIMDVVENLIKCAERRQEAGESPKIGNARSTVTSKPLPLKMRSVSSPKRVVVDAPRKLPLLLPKQVPPMVLKRTKYSELKNSDVKQLRPSANKTMTKVPSIQPKIYPPLLPRPPHPGPSSVPSTNPQPLVVSVCAKPLNPPIVAPIHKEPNLVPSKPIQPLQVHECRPRIESNNNVAHRNANQNHKSIRHFIDQPLDLRTKTEATDERPTPSRLKVPVQFVIPQLQTKVSKTPSPPSLLMRSLEKPPLSNGPIHFDVPASSVKETRKPSPRPPLSTSPSVSHRSSLESSSHSESLRRKKEQESILRSLLLENPPDEAFDLTDKGGSDRKAHNNALSSLVQSSGPVIADVFSLTNSSPEGMSRRSVSPKASRETSPSDGKASANAFDFTASYMEKLANADCDFLKEFKQMETVFGPDIPLPTSFTETDEAELLKDPVAARERINHLHKEILYLEMMAAQKEKERMLILHFRKYKEEVMKRLFRYTVRSQLREKSRLGIISSANSSSSSSKRLAVSGGKEGGVNTSNVHSHHLPLQQRLSDQKESYQRPLSVDNDDNHQQRGKQTRSGFPTGNLCPKEACLVRPMVVHDNSRKYHSSHSRQSSGSFASIESLVAKPKDKDASCEGSFSSIKDADPPVLDLTSHKLPKSVPSMFENSVAAHSRRSPLPGATLPSGRGHPATQQMSMTPFTAVQQTNFLLNTLQGNGGAYTVTTKGIPDGDKSKGYRGEINLPWSSSPTPLSKAGNHYNDGAFSRPHSASSSGSFAPSISPLAKETSITPTTDSKESLGVTLCREGTTVNFQSDRKFGYAGLLNHSDIAGAQSHRIISPGDHLQPQHSPLAAYGSIFPAMSHLTSHLVPGLHPSLALGVPWWPFPSTDYLSNHRESTRSTAQRDTTENRTVR